MDYKFTQDWFSHNIPIWEKCLVNLPDKKRFLEIGSFEGRSAVWTVENLMSDGGMIDCIDIWIGESDFGAVPMSIVDSHFNHNARTVIAKYPKRSINKIYGYSYDALRQMKKNTYDMIYLDGSHHSFDVMSDACLSWPLLKENGILVFDDYEWKHYSNEMHNPKPAIDLFLQMVSCKVLHKGYQVIVQKRGTK